MDPLIVIIWTCVSVFILTAIMAILHMAGIYTLPNKKHGEILFKVLVVEIAIVAVVAFGTYLKGLNSVKVIPAPEVVTPAPEIVKPTPKVIAPTPVPWAKIKVTEALKNTGYRSGHKTNHCINQGYEGYQPAPGRDKYPWGYCFKHE